MKMKKSDLFKLFLLFNLAYSPLLPQEFSVEKEKNKQKQTQTFSLEEYIKEKKKYLEEKVIIEGKDYLVKFTDPKKENKEYSVYINNKEVKNLGIAQKALFAALIKHYVDILNKDIDYALSLVGDATEDLWQTSWQWLDAFNVSVWGDEELVRYANAPTYYEKMLQEQLQQSWRRMERMAGEKDWENVLREADRFLGGLAKLNQKEQNPEYLQERMAQKQLLESRKAMWKETTRYQVKSNMEKSIEKLYRAIETEKLEDEKDRSLFHRDSRLDKIIEKNLIRDPRYLYSYDPRLDKIVELGAISKYLINIIPNDQENKIDFDKAVDIYIKLSEKPYVLNNFAYNLEFLKLYPTFLSISGISKSRYYYYLNTIRRESRTGRPDRREIPQIEEQLLRPMRTWTYSDSKSLPFVIEKRFLKKEKIYATHLTKLIIAVYYPVVLYDLYDPTYYETFKKYFDLFVIDYDKIHSENKDYLNIPKSESIVNEYKLND